MKLDEKKILFEFKQTSLEKKYKEIDTLKKYISVQGKILPRRVTQLNAKRHRQITKEIKQARILGLLMFTNHS